MKLYIFILGFFLVTHLTHGMDQQETDYNEEPLPEFNDNDEENYSLKFPNWALKDKSKKSTSKSPKRIPQTEKARKTKTWPPAELRKKHSSRKRSKKREKSSNFAIDDQANSDTEYEQQIRWMSYDELETKHNNFFQEVELGDCTYRYALFLEYLKQKANWRYHIKQTSPKTRRLLIKTSSGVVSPSYTDDRLFLLEKGWRFFPGTQ